MTGRLLTYLKSHKGAALLAILLATGTILAGIGLMTSSGYLISRAAERPMIVDLFMVTAAVRFFGVSRAVVRYFDRVVSHDLTFRILLRIRTAFYERLNAFSQKWLMTKRPGELLTGMISDVETLQNVYLRIISPVIVAIIICVVTFALLMFIDVALALAVSGIFIINGLPVPSLALRLARGTGKTERHACGNMKVFLMDKIQGMHDCLWLHNQKRVLQDFMGIQKNTDGVQHKNASTSGAVEGLSALFANSGTFVALLLAIPLVLNGELQSVMLAALVLGVFSSFEALQGLSNAFVQYDGLLEASKNLRALTETENTTGAEKYNGGYKMNTTVTAPEETTGVEGYSGEQRSDTEAKIFATEHPRISFHDVSFSYDQEENVLHDIAFELLPGSRTAIVGPTGSGKSTIINLLTGFWEPASGEVRADGCCINLFDMKSYRSILGVVSQDTFIFNRSVRENLLIADPGASDQQLEYILINVGLGFLASKLDLVLGSQGMKLSGGERQLFALARALVKESSVWVFDELSANMDAATERKVLDALWNALGDRTLLMVTHRLVDMEKMHQILVINEGVIIERGSHETLLSSNGRYARMYAQQMEVLRQFSSPNNF